METIVAILCGVACGIAAATPLLLQLRHEEPDFGRGFGSVIVAFMVIQTAMFAVYAFWPGLLMAFAVPAVLSFLAVVLWAVVRRGPS